MHVYSTTLFQDAQGLGGSSGALRCLALSPPRRLVVPACHALGVLLLYVCLLLFTGPWDHP